MDFRILMTSDENKELEDLLSLALLLRYLIVSKEDYYTLKYEGIKKLPERSVCCGLHLCGNASFHSHSLWVVSIQELTEIQQYIFETLN